MKGDENNISSSIRYADFIKAKQAGAGRPEPEYMDRCYGRPTLKIMWCLRKLSEFVDCKIVVESM